MEQSAVELRNELMKLATRFAVIAASFLVGALTVDAASEAGIIKGEDEFEFVYRVKLP